MRVSGEVNDSRRDFLKQAFSGAGAVAATAAVDGAAGLLHAAERVVKKKQPTPLHETTERLHTVVVPSGEEYTRDEYIDKAITIFQERGVIKKLKHFEFNVAKDRAEYNKEAYDNYIDRIKLRADVYNNPRQFASFLTDLYKLTQQHDNSTKLPAVTLGEADKILASRDYRKAHYELLVVKHDLNKEGASVQEVRNSLRKAFGLN